MNNYYNAAKGAHLLFIATILQLIGSVLMSLSTVVMAGTYSIGGTLAMAGIGGVIVIVGYIMQLVAIANGGKDESMLRTAFILAIIGLILAIINAFFSNSALTIINMIISIILTVMVILGFNNVMNNIGRSDVARKGNMVLIIYVIATVIGQVINARVKGISAIYSLGSLQALIGMAVAVLILSVVGLVVYIIYLKSVDNALNR